MPVRQDSARVPEHKALDAQILPIGTHHIDGFHRVLDAVARERKFLARLKAPKLHRTRDFVLTNIAQGHPHFVAVSDGVVGWCDILPRGGPLHPHVGVLGIGLLPEFRGYGLGTALLQTTLKRARERNLVRIELSVFSDNAAAISLYEKAGFRKEGELQNQALIDQQAKTTILMAIVDHS